jgi:ELWxxDGT repeat protein
MVNTFIASLNQRHQKDATMKTPFNLLTRLLVSSFLGWGMLAYGQLQPVPTNYAVTLLKDINPGQYGSYYSKEALAIGNTLYFSAGDASYGDELWKTTGTQSSTVRVKNINPNGSSDPSHMTDVNGTLFFDAIGTTGRELYKSDGSSEGTILVKDIHLTGDANPRTLSAYNGMLLFFADNGTNGMELWKSDGTQAGTVQVKNINQNGSSAPLDFYGKMAALNGIAYFIANDGVTGEELWRTDGTAAGTYLVKNINPTGSADILELVVVNGMLLFVADDGSHGAELWKSDGMTSGTTLVKDLQSDGGIHMLSFSVPIGETLFFSAVVNGDGELYKSDGTASGTVRVKNINTGGSSGASNLTRVGNSVFFLANDGIYGYELWKSDGTQAGTVLVKDLTPNGSSSINEMQEANGRLFFTLDDDEPYVSNGTASGTKMLKEINPSGFAVTRGFVALENQVFFFAFDPTAGRELFKATPCTYCPIASGRLGEEEELSSLQLKVLTNPVQESITVDINGASAGPLQVQLLTAQGRTIETRRIDQPSVNERQQFDVMNQPAGLLLLRVTTNSGSKSVKIVKTN